MNINSAQYFPFAQYIEMMTSERGGESGSQKKKAEGAAEAK